MTKLQRQQQQRDMKVARALQAMDRDDDKGLAAIEVEISELDAEIAVLESIADLGAEMTQVGETYWMMDEEGTFGTGPSPLVAQAQYLHALGVS